jgi:integrase
MNFTYSKLRLVNIDKPKSKELGKTVYLKKWYVTYIIKYIDGVWPEYPVKEQQSLKNKMYPKLFGKEHEIKLNEIKDFNKRLEAANELLEEIEDNLISGIDPRLRRIVEDRVVEQADQQAQGKTLDEALEITIKYMGWDGSHSARKITAKNNLAFFRNGFRHFLHYIGKEQNVLSVTKEDLQQFVILHANPDGAVINYKGKDYKVGHWLVKTCFEKVRCIGYIYNALLDAELITVSPCLGVTDVRKKVKKSAKPKPEQVRYDVWSDDEMNTFHQIGNTDKYLQQYAVGLITYYSYIRTSEILRLQFSMLDIENSRFVIPKGSTILKNYRATNHKTNYIKLPPKLMIVLTKYIDTFFKGNFKPHYYLFPDEQVGFTTEYDYNNFKKQFEEGLRKSIGTDKNPYALKHTGVTHFFKREMEKGKEISFTIGKLMKMCMHHDIAETMHYLSINLGLNIEDDSDDDWGH